MKQKSVWPPAIVIGLDSLPGLQTARIFARHGVRVIAIANNPKHHTCRTRVCEKIYFADCRSDEFVNTLDEISRDLGEPAVLVPVIDPAVLAISAHRARLGDRFLFSLTDDDTINLLTNKSSFYAFTKDKNFLIPDTEFLRDRTDALAAAETVSFPAVLKPSIRLPAWESQTHLKAIRIDDAEELLDWYEQCKDWTDVVILQQWIEGGDDSLYSFNGYFDERSEPLATFIAKKVRQWPPNVGFSSLGEECRDDFILEESIRLFKEVGYKGLAYVEFKRDTVDGNRYMIEANLGRPTGRSAIAEAGGVELLFTMYCDVVGLPLPKNRVQRYQGAKWIDLRHDLQSALYYWRRGELTVREWLESWRGKKTYAYFSWSDPMPFIFDLLRVVLRRERRKRRSEIAPPPSRLGRSRGT